jgi:hypothetical protein
VSPRFHLTERDLEIVRQVARHRFLRSTHLFALIGGSPQKIHERLGPLLLAIPIAGGLLVRWGVDLPMSVGAIAMSASTIIVAANAQLLRRLRLQHKAL